MEDLHASNRNNIEEVSSESNEDETCVSYSEKAKQVKRKGSEIINNLSSQKKIKAVNVDQQINEDCCLELYNEYNSLNAQDFENAQNLEPLITESSICFFCGKAAKLSDKVKRGIDVYQVKTEQFHNTIRNIIKKRNDEWADEVKERIGTLQLHLSGAIYHQKCNLKFRREKATHLSIGRPRDEDRQTAFFKVVNYMKERESEAFTLNELSSLMNESSDEYCRNFLKAKLIEHFSDDIFFVQCKGKPDFVLFSTAAYNIISESYEKKKYTNEEADKKKILEISAKLLADIQSIPSNKSEYPTSDQISNIESHKTFVPDSLVTLLSGIIKVKKPDLKIVSIGEAICQAASPRRIIAPLQLGLGVCLHHTIGSKFVVKTLHQLGFCSSYDEVQRFELCAAASGADDSNQIQPLSTNQVIKFVADNVDHDTRTIDGENTFHGMGMISALTPSTSTNRLIKRTKLSIEDIRSIATVKIHQYLGEPTEKKKIYGDIKSLIGVYIMRKVDLLLNVTWKIDIARPSWSGIMQTVNRGDHPGTSSINILPMIDLNPSNMNCVYSTLIYLSTQARKYAVDPVVAFDQPLWWKAQIVIQNEPMDSPLKRIVLLLGGFHTEMSFLGCIGNLFEGLGLQEVLETIYAANSVPHILSGKAFSRAVRGHLLIHQVLNQLLMQEFIPVKMSQMEWKEALNGAKIIYDDLITEKISVTDVESSELLKSIEEEGSAFKLKIGNESRTAKMWLQYMDMVDILKCYNRSERTGNFSMFLPVLRKMHPYFAAAGHNAYAKCIYIFLQQMLELEKTHPKVYADFCAGHFVIRRSDRYWSANACDLTIEQTLMRNVKSQGGLTRGRGIGENQRLIWIHSMPACVDIKNAMQQFTGLYYETSEQHKDVGVSRQQRDLKDMNVVYEFLNERSPFAPNRGCALRNIYNGVEANKDVNVDEASQIGEKIISSMKDQLVSNYTFKKINRTVTMPSKNTILIDREVISIDPQLLFQRLLIIVRGMDDSELIDVFKYELSQRPSSLFDDQGLMRSGDAKTLVNALYKDVTINIHKDCFVGCRHVLSGDFLMGKIVWKKNQTYADICNEYIAYVRQFQGLVIVFEDATLDPSIKDEFNFRQCKGAYCIDVTFTETMPFNSKKESFLFNANNKKRFTDMLSARLVEWGYTVIRKATDINVTIAREVIQLASMSNVAVISNDINLLFVLCTHYNMNCQQILFQYFTNDHKQQVWDVQHMHSTLGGQTMTYLPFVRAICGSQTTSELYGIGTAAPYKRIIKDNEFQRIAEVFTNPSSTIPEITKSGDEALVILYNGKKNQTLNSLRYHRFHDKLFSSKTYIKVQTLPPTEAAAHYHHLRVYLQTQIWCGNFNLNPLEYGWKKDGQRLVPTTTDLEVGPIELLSKIKCSCNGDCNTNKCSCHKMKMKCSVACTECRGTYCLNSSKLIEDDEDEL